MTLRQRLGREISFLHVGLPKCASSFFEREYFVEQNGFFNLMKNPRWNEFLEYQLLTSQSSFFAQRPPDVISEKPMSKMLIGASTASFVSGVDYELALQRWKEIAPRAKVLIVVRNQMDFVFSGYGQRILSGYSKSLDEHIRELIWNAQGSLWGRMFFDKLFLIAKKYYDDVYLLPLEQMKEGEGFRKSLDQFFGVPNLTGKVRVVRPSLQESTLFLIRQMNRILPHGIGLATMSVMPNYEGGVERFRVNNVPGLPPSDRRRRVINRIGKSIGQRCPPSKSLNNRFRKEYSQLFEDWFAESNRNLQRLTGVDLGRYGYLGIDPPDAG